MTVFLAFKKHHTAIFLHSIRKEKLSVEMQRGGRDHALLKESQSSGLFAHGREERPEEREEEATAGYDESCTQAKSLTQDSTYQRTERERAFANKLHARADTTKQLVGRDLLSQALRVHIEEGIRETEQQ